MLIIVFIIIIINGIWSTCNTLGMRATPCWKHNSFTLYLNVVNAQFTMSTIYIFVYWNNVNMFQSTSHCIGHNIQVPVQLGHKNVSLFGVMAYEWIDTVTALIHIVNDQGYGFLNCARFPYFIRYRLTKKILQKLIKNTRLNSNTLYLDITYFINSHGKPLWEMW